MPDSGNGMDLTRAVVRIDGDNSGLTAAFREAEQLTTLHGRKLENLTKNQLSNISRANKLSAAESAALTEKFAVRQVAAFDDIGKATTRTTGGIGRLNTAMFSLLRQTTGLPPAVTQATRALGTFAIGFDGVLIGVTAITALALAFEALTSKQREARQETDKLVQSLKDEAFERIKGPIGIAQEKAAKTRAELMDLVAQRATLQAETSADITTGVGAVNGQEQARRIAVLTNKIYSSAVAFGEAQHQVDVALDDSLEAQGKLILDSKRHQDEIAKGNAKVAESAAELDDKLMNLTISLPKVTGGVEAMMQKAFGWATFTPPTKSSIDTMMARIGTHNQANIFAGGLGTNRRSPLAGAATTQPGNIFNGAQLGVRQFDGHVKDATKDTAILADGIVNMAEVGAAAIAGFVTGAKVSFHDFVQTALAELSRLIAKLLVVTALKALFTGTGTFAGTAIGKIIAGGLEQRASGGPVRAGVPYLVGERGPELFVPSASGAIAAHGSGGGGMAAALLASLGPMPPMMSPADYATNQWVRRAFKLLVINERETS